LSTPLPPPLDQLWYTNGWFIQPGPKHGKPDDPWTAEVLGLKNFMGFVANDLQSPEASSKFPFLSITIQKYQGCIPESTSQSEARYFSFSTAYRSALAGFRKEVIGKGSPDCSSLSLSVTSLLTLHVLKPSTAKEAESQHLT
jgi:hypothetical protein